MSGSTIVWDIGAVEDFDTVLQDEAGSLIGDAFDRAVLHVALKDRCHMIEGVAGTYTVGETTGTGWSFPLDAISMADVPVGQWALSMWVHDARGPHLAFRDGQIVVRGAC